MKVLNRVLRTHGFTIALAASLGSAAAAPSGPDPRFPATRLHVRHMDGVAWRCESRLSTLVELNFTMGYPHREGKQAISAALSRIALAYGKDGVPAFRIRSLQSSQSGSVIGEVPAFGFEDLIAGDVLVGNNIGDLGSKTLGEARRKALQAAIDSAGRGYLAFHGSAETGGDRAWPWLTGALEPRAFQGHGARIPVPVYKNEGEAEHVILQGILEVQVERMEVPQGIDAAGNEVLAPLYPARSMLHEAFRFAKDISRDPATREKVTVLLLHDDRALLSQLDRQHIRPGGGLHTYLYQVGKGMTSYIPAGHSNDEVMQVGRSFDGGTGDFDRYVAQTLFFLAGYDRKPCDTSCAHLPVVDARDHIVPFQVGLPGIGPNGKGMKKSRSRTVDVLGRLKDPRRSVSEAQIPLKN